MLYIMWWYVPTYNSDIKTRKYCRRKKDKKEDIEITYVNKVIHKSKIKHPNIT